MDIKIGIEAAERNAKLFWNTDWSLRKFPTVIKRKHGHHIIVVSQQIMVPKSAGIERLNAITVAS